MTHRIPERPTLRATPAPRALRRLIVLDDHARLPGRFFGRMTAAVLAGL